MRMTTTHAPTTAAASAAAAASSWPQPAPWPHGRPHGAHGGPTSIWVLRCKTDSAKIKIFLELICYTKSLRFTLKVAVRYLFQSVYYRSVFFGCCCASIANPLHLHWICIGFALDFFNFRVGAGGGFGVGFGSVWGWV